jgi:hypothetical protein
MGQPSMNQDSAAWLFFVHAAFAASLFLTCLGIYHLPVTLWVKGYFAMGLFFTVGSTITLSKTLRDQHEARKLVNRIDEVKTEKLLNDYSMTGSRGAI